MDGIYFILFSNSHRSFKFDNLHIYKGNFYKFERVNVRDYRDVRGERLHLNYGAFGLSPSWIYFRWVRF